MFASLEPPPGARGFLVTLDRATVEHIAMLARLGLSDEEMESMRDKLSSILDYISLLQEVDTDDIPPTAQVIQQQNVMRDDEVQPSLPRELVLLNAPRSEDGYLRVNAVLDQS
jgi:aspartyl-tRNA(Asn)/glutamyl-tRNA(Gln) amidotransferase subunit C